jgi:pyruvate/2-oxoglutarate dehydrogenase complex dihydrolipoamide dehydrogenase (E3) component
VLILGGGNAGLSAAEVTRAAGLSVALVEERDLGGTCPNRGCAPKKVLVAAAHALHEIAQAKVHCIKVVQPELDWAALIDREKQLINHIPQSLARNLAEVGVEVIREHAAFVGPNAVRVGQATIEARYRLQAAQAADRGRRAHMITSDEVLSERTLPRNVVFVGGGFIALEFSHVYARALTTIKAMISRPCIDGTCRPWVGRDMREQNPRRDWPSNEVEDNRDVGLAPGSDRRIAREFERDGKRGPEPGSEPSGGGWRLASRPWQVAAFAPGW